MINIFVAFSYGTVEGLAIQYIVKFIYSEKAPKFCKISTIDLSYVVPAKSTVDISQNYVAFSEYMNFTKRSDKIRGTKYLFENGAFFSAARCKKIH